MFVNLRPYLDLFNVYGFLLGMLFIQLVLIFSEIKYLAHRRRRCRRNLDQVQFLFGRMTEGLPDRHHSELLAFAVDDPHFPRPYLLVYSYAFTDVSPAYVCTSIEFIFSPRKDINSSIPNGPEFSPSLRLSINARSAASLSPIITEYGIFRIVLFLILLPIFSLSASRSTLTPRPLSAAAISFAYSACRSEIVSTDTCTGASQSGNAPA